MANDHGFDFRVRAPIISVLHNAMEWHAPPLPHAQKSRYIRYTSYIAAQRHFFCNRFRICNR